MRHRRVRRAACLRRSRRGACVAGSVNENVAPRAGVALDPQAAAEVLDDLAADRQPEPGAVRASAVSVSPTCRNFSKMTAWSLGADARRRCRSTSTRSVAPVARDASPRRARAVGAELRRRWTAG